MHFTFGLTLLIHIAILFGAFLWDFAILLWKNPRIIRSSVIIAVMIEMLYYFFLSLTAQQQ